MKLENISKIYDNKVEKLEILKEINYEFEKGKLYAIMGHSGSGKSTLISIMGLMLTPTTGSLYIDKKKISFANQFECANLRMKKIGFVFQDFNLDENLNALDNVILPMLINKEIKKEERNIKATELLEKVGLKNRVKHYPKALSGGEQGRVAIARSLANNPDIILADEPTGNLDQENEKMIFKELKKLSKDGKCVIVVTHSNEIKEYADVILQLKDGNIKEMKL